MSSRCNVKLVHGEKSS